jgi:hypothetical protein
LACRTVRTRPRELLEYEPLACVGDCGELRAWLLEHA